VKMHFPVTLVSLTRFALYMTLKRISDCSAVNPLPNESLGNLGELGAFLQTYRKLMQQKV
jgi:hypothetical protein